MVSIIVNSHVDIATRVAMVSIVMWTLWILPQEWPWWEVIWTDIATRVARVSLTLFRPLVPCAVSIHTFHSLIGANCTVLLSRSILSFLVLSSRSSFCNPFHLYIYSTYIYFSHKLRFVHRFDSSTRRTCWQISTSTRGHVAFILAQW